MTFLKNLFFVVFSLFILNVFAQKSTAVKTYKVGIIGFYNLENYYDTIDQPNIKDDEYTPNGEKKYTGEIYKDKINRLVEVLSQVGKDISPDGLSMFGVAEIENESVLYDLVNHPKLKERNYKIVHYDSPDERGVDVGLIYNPKYFTVMQSRPLRVNLEPSDYTLTGAEILIRNKECIEKNAQDEFSTGNGSKGCFEQEILDEATQNPKKKFKFTTSHKTRDVLWVTGNYNGDTIHVFVNHWPSRRGGEEASAPGRAIAARVSKQLIDSMMAINSNTKAIVMGDLNDDPVSPSMTKVLGTKGDIEKVEKGGIYNPWVNFYKQGIGTLAYNDAWNLFDQIVITQPFLDKNQSGYFFNKAYIFNRDFMVQKTGKYKGFPLRTFSGNIYNSGYSDHFPTYIVLYKEKK